MGGALGSLVRDYTTIPGQRQSYVQDMGQMVMGQQLINTMQQLPGESLDTYRARLREAFSAHEANESANFYGAA